MSSSSTMRNMCRGRRGMLIVFEGCDRSGKTTQCQRLVKDLNDNDETNKDNKDSSKFMRFPDRTTKIGKVIDQYLRGEQTLDDHVIHLLFSTNRWEKVAELEAALTQGHHVIVDRYAFSGVAFSAAKKEMSLEWCKQPDRGLPKPDLVCFLDVSPEEANKRGGFGDEVYEKKEFQAKVRKNYDALMEDNWNVIDTDKKSLDEVYAEINTLVRSKIELHRNNDKPLEKLWPMPE